ncbi:hypothetical protein MICAD_3650001 [Microcystis aeruginosa PCC 7941]|jgi:hypothetical protein|nr:hypothetical protein MICAD_3650001 [Microcystis aeruginosa PCC 7941]
MLKSSISKGLNVPDWCENSYSLQWIFVLIGLTKLLPKGLTFLK